MRLRHSWQARGKAALALFALLFALALAGCGGGSNTPSPITLGPAPTILTGNLPDGTVGVAYSVTLQVFGGTAPLTFSVSAGTLPAGLSLNTATGAISGTPTLAQTQMFTLRVQDNSNRSTTRDYTVRIGNAVALVELVSVAPDGTPGNSDSGSPALSDDGRFVAFTSFATDLVPNDTNLFADVFLRDRTCGQTARVSVASGGTQGDGDSFSPALSSLTGGFLFVGYASNAKNLVANDTNNGRDIFVTAVSVSGCTVTPVTTARVSVASDGTQAAIVVDPPPTTPTPPVSNLPHLSLDASRILYLSTANNLDQADTNGANDAFLTELDFTGGVLSVVRTRRVGLLRIRLANGVPRTTANIFSDTTIGSVSLNMTPGAQVGNVVELLSGAGAGQVRTVTANDAFTLTVDPPWAVTPNNTTVFHVTTENDVSADVFTATTIGNSGLTLADDEMINRLVQIVSGTGAEQTRRISDSNATTLTVDTAFNPVPDGTSVFRVVTQLSGAQRCRLSADGTFVGFTESTGVLLEDPAAGQTRRASVAQSGASTGGTLSDISADGSLVLFNSGDSGVVDGDSNQTADLFLRDLGAQTTERASVASDGTEADFLSDVVAALSSGGQLVAFSSIATTFDPDDRNQARDIYARERMAGTTTRVSLGMDSTNPNGESVDPALSRDAAALAFSSVATNLIPSDDNSARDVFLVATGVSDPPMIVIPSLPAASVGAPYSAALTVAGGRRPLFWTLEEGILPPGLFLDSQSGEISGLPQKPGRFTFTLLVMDADRPARRALRTFTVTVE
ncbi:MAG: Ig domain-containing protein [Acidobacteria bacterium]|nr:Ig domain-containing protein [Acidobacteriota bacterium]